MVQPVRVRLVFPRSGQKLFVDVPQHIVCELSNKGSEQRENRLEFPVAGAISQGQRAGETSAFAR
jgi:hypothetical protein